MLFSVITVCRNNLDELILTHASLVGQDCPDYEWIVVDGNSTDGTREWLERNHDSAGWISENDAGIYDAMNKGAAMAHGKYLVFMNSGDEFHDSDVLSKVEQVIRDNSSPPVLIYGDSIDVDEDGKEYYRKAKKAAAIKYGMITQHQAMFFKRAIVPEPAYPESFTLSADYALISSIIHNNPKGSIINIPYPLCKFKMGGTNESKRFKAIKEDLVIRRKYLGLSSPEATWLYFLHYNHAILKHLFKKSRFMRHKSVIKDQ